MDATPSPKSLTFRIVSNEEHQDSVIQDDHKQK